MRALSPAVKSAMWGALLALGLFGAFVYALWPTIRERVVAGIKEEVHAQRVAGGVASDFVQGIVDLFK